MLVEHGELWPLAEIKTPFTFTVFPYFIFNMYK